MPDNEDIVKEAIVVPRSEEYTYYNLLSNLFSLDLSPKSIKDFRYKSLEEGKMWGSEFSQIAPAKKLLFYAMLDEVRFIIGSYRNELIQKPFGMKEDEILLINYKIMLIGYIGYKGLGDYFINDMLDHFGEKVEPLKKILFAGYEHAMEFQDSVFWERINDTTYLEDLAFDLMKIYRSSKFSKNVQQYYNSNFINIRRISDTKILDKLFSIKEFMESRIVGSSKTLEEEERLVVFFDRIPGYLYGPIEGGSFYSAVFRDLVRETEAQHVINTLEKMIVFAGSRESAKNIVRNATFRELGRLILDRENSLQLSSSSAKSALSKVLFQGGKSEHLRGYFNEFYCVSIIEKGSQEVENIVKKEIIATVEMFQKKKEEDLLTDEVKLEITKLFFLNIFEKIKIYFSTTAPLVFEGLVEEQREHIEKKLLKVIKEKIHQERKRVSWL